ncbi:polyprenyl synthetase [Helicobacter sp. 12S02634-8]|uniref:polyprenyl synthetase family protein n=1 Tax=Helicobacter sp. 12S02634-8 TaxID=1476199 RepID=UPI000BA7A5C2|nr:polyprenyl synthetase family protein [Helicobacter sp. 12S02634-8]PAF47096.1 polyprenyl synthetase [Helicobacter sp. 12S02634-8]
MLEKIQEKIQSFLHQVEGENVASLSAQMHFGKMLRSKLILAICPHHPKTLELCAIIEMIQSASLLHDDVIDASQMRRGKSSLNAVFGDKNAIMLGDVFYAKAFFELTKLPPPIAQCIAKSVIELAKGEIDDVFLSTHFNPHKDKYLQMLQDKTASLIAASAESAAILAGLEASKYRDYGRNLGIAFQIIDDLLDITQDSKTLGKPAMSDFKEGKTTLPYILLYAALPEEQKKILISYFREDTIQAQKWLKEHFEEYGIIALVAQEAREYGQRALAAIAKESNPLLEEVVQTMIYREF